MLLSQLDDKALVKDYIAGNENALAQLLRRHKRSLYHYILSKVKNGDLANDIFQDTFVKVIKTLKAGNYNEEGKFLPWVMRIAHNLVIDHFRRTNKVKMISESSSSNENFNIFSILALEEDNVQDRISKTELETQLVKLIEHLPISQKEIIKMRIFQDLSFKEIADLEDISINTALGRMRYGLINLRKLIKKHQLVVDIS
jgi:RNA polymerase sigma-70 factor (ECF subfamily)